MFSEYLSIGEVLKPQGVRGQVKVRPDTNDPARFSQLQQVYIQQDNAYIAWPVSDVAVRDGYVYCTLNHAQTRDDAEKQRGAMLYIDREHAVPLAENEYYISDLIGCTVQDQQGQAIGTLADVLQDSFCMEECCEKKADLLRVRQLLETLPARERQILLLRYGLAGQPPLTQLETAQLLGISRSYVSRLESHALCQLRQHWDKKPAQE